MTLLESYLQTYTQPLTESEMDDTLRRVTFQAKKLGFEVTPVKKVGGYSFKVGDYTFGNKGDGQWQIVNKAGKEVDYLFGKKLGDVVKLMADYSKK
ncbi:hypothetical protein [Serratia phage X20]|uniref:Uncharacterized protein n=3 Tax=Winklervirus TaxID=2560256 RepID=A0A1Z1LZ38_9CAUD|nr:internal virion protein [Serratia phage CHI14]YP_010092274.1 internal virion protein [Serratia phage X20]ARW57823.1 hypothetical protein [Serratia phage CBH8]QYN80571.1 hypothetical protein [Kosakonia phage Kc304]UJJ22115.1 hypothetical protein [Erwinia phage Virsaitis27]UYM28776.1 hypothetical protein [Serratia phage vB_SspM_LC53]ARW57548.1 hypothetical protein [Serratia phage CHI14]